MTAGFDSVAEKTKNQVTDKIRILDTKRNEVETKLEDLRSSTSNASEDVVLGVKIAWNDLKDTVNSVSERF